MYKAKTVIWGELYSSEMIKQWETRKYIRAIKKNKEVKGQSGKATLNKI